MQSVAVKTLRSGLDPSQFPDAPSWALELANQVEQLRVDLIAIRVALIEHRVLRPHEITDAQAKVTALAEQQLRGAIDMIFRQNTARKEAQSQERQNDPRRPPQQ